jgi:two-component system OmpR family sensor kinase
VRHLSLRTRVVLGVLVLSAAVLVGIDVATSSSLRSFLIQRTDNSLQSAHQEIEAALRSGQVTSTPAGPPPSRGAPPPRGARGAPSPGDLSNLTRSLPGLFIETRSKDGKVLYKGQVAQFFRTGKPPPPPRLPATIALRAPSGGEFDRLAYLTVPAVSGSGRYRVRASLDPGSDSVLIIATSLNAVDGTLHRLFLIELFGTAGGLAAILVLGLWVVRLGLRPLEAMGKTAAKIAAGDLSRRVDRAEKRTEVGRLGLALNAMLAQIETAFKARAASEARLRRFVADASHELRNPIAGVRAYAELFKEGARQRPEDLARAMTGISRESDRMSILVEDLLLLAHLDEGRALETAPVELEEVVFEAVEIAHAVEPERPIEIDVEQAVVLGDRERLRQLLDNLLSNIRAHTPADARVHVSLKRANGHALLAVSDSGPGIDPDDLERVFERFYRADPLRSRARGGAGLGLSIVAAVAAAHGGAVSVRSEAGSGTTFEISLPLGREQ